MFAQPWVGAPLYLCTPHCALWGSVHRQPCPLSCQRSWNWALQEVQVHFHHCPLGSEMNWGSCERLLVRLETLGVRQANKQVMPSQPPHHCSSFLHPPGVQQNKVEPSIRVPMLAPSYPACAQGRAMLLPWTIPHSGFGFTVFACGVGAWMTR